MSLSIKLAVAVLLSLPAADILAQENAALCIDANVNESTVVVVSDVTAAAATPCPTPDATAFLVQGKRSQLRVFNRKFLSDYSFTVDGSTQVQSVRIEDLDEASNLTVPLGSTGSTAVSKGAVPKGLSTAGALPLRTAQSLLTELMNPATSSNPASELESDWLVVQGEIKKLAIDEQAFDSLWGEIKGVTISDANRACLSAFGTPTLATAQECFEWISQDISAGPLSGAIPSNEDAFRQLIVTDTDAIAMVAALGTKINHAVPLMTTQLSGFDGDLTQFRADISTLAGNIAAANDAAKLVNAIPLALKLAQIKGWLIQGLNGSKTVIDPVELNVLSQQLLDASKNPQLKRLVDTNAEELRKTGTSIDTQIASSSLPNVSCTSVVSCNTLFDARYKATLADEYKNLNKKLPEFADAVNAQQSELLARTNSIYDRSRVAEPLDKVVNLGGLTGNLFVYFTIRRIETFTRFTVPPLTVQGVLPAVSATALPPAAPAAAAAATPATTTSTTTTGSTTTTVTTTTPAAAATSSSGGTTGTVVAHGVVEVHDIYRATVVAAFAFSAIKESPQSSTVTSGMTTIVPPASTATVCTSTASCSQVTSGSRHTAVIMGLSVHFLPYDTFPTHRTWTSKVWAEKLGFFGGLSVQKVNDYYGALDLEPIDGVQIMAGMNFFRQAGLAPGFTIGDIYAGVPTFTGPMAWSKGAFLGLGLNLHIFRKVFGSVTGVGTTAKTGGT